jgi:hypothetical protein
MTKSYDLIGAALDWAVAKCEYETIEIADMTSANEVIGKCLMWLGHSDDFGTMCYEPSTDYSIGGPIIDREKITLIYVPEDDPNPLPDGDTWTASVETLDYGCTGKTVLIAAMRCYVASKLGEEINIPQELMS